MATLPPLYLAAQRAVIEAYTVDECEQWDLERALASYLRQAEDDSLERYIKRIRRRAVRRMRQVQREGF